MIDDRLKLIYNGPHHSQTFYNACPPNPQCLGCVSHVQGSLNLESYSEPFFVLTEVPHANILKEQLARRVCALLNAGGGYILLGWPSHSSAQQLNGIQNDQYAHWFQQQFFPQFYSDLFGMIMPNSVPVSGQLELSYGLFCSFIGVYKSLSE